MVTIKLMAQFGGYIHARCTKCNNSYFGFKRNLYCYECNPLPHMTTEEQRAMRGSGFTSNQQGEQS